MAKKSRCESKGVGVRHRPKGAKSVILANSEFAAPGIRFRFLPLLVHLLLLPPAILIHLIFILQPTSIRMLCNQPHMYTVSHNSTIAL